MICAGGMRSRRQPVQSPGPRSADCGRPAAGLNSTLERADVLMAKRRYGEAGEMYDKLFKIAAREQRRDAEVYLEGRAARHRAWMAGEKPARSGAMLPGVADLKRRARERRLLLPIGHDQPPHVGKDDVAQYRSEGFVTIRGLILPAMIKSLSRVGWGFAEATSCEPRVQQIRGTGGQAAFTVKGWGDGAYHSRVVDAARQLVGGEPGIVTSWLALADATARPWESADPRDSVNYQAGDVSFHRGRTQHCFTDAGSIDRCGLSAQLWPSATNPNGVFLLQRPSTAPSARLSSLRPMGTPSPQRPGGPNSGNRENSVSVPDVADRPSTSEGTTR